MVGGVRVLGAGGYGWFWGFWGAGALRGYGAAAVVQMFQQGFRGYGQQLWLRGAGVQGLWVAAVVERCSRVLGDEQEP